MSLASLPNQLNRTVLIRASRDIVFRYFTDSARWASWWGSGSSIDPRVGGDVHICYPGGIQVAGNVLEVSAPSRIVFTYGFVSGAPIAAASSRITIALFDAPAGTRLELRHEFAEADAAVRDDHVQGWRYQLSVFSNVVANERYADATEIVDRWFDAWAEPNETTRDHTLRDIASNEVHFADRYSNLESAEDVRAHIAASQRFMPGVRLVRSGAVRHCQGMVLADWTVAGPDGAVAMHGTNLFVFGPSGKLESVTGFAA